jgi:GMP synthase (glutamine-hydrolysing)
MKIRHHEWVLILDYGSQYTQLIARRFRELNVYCEIHPFNKELSAMDEQPPDAVILSGGPRSVNEEDAPGLNTHIFDWEVPILGICYGLQLLAHSENPGCVEEADKREFGRSELIVDDSSDLLKDIPAETVVWMSHSDQIMELPPSYEVIGHTLNAETAAVRHKEKPIYGVQFHPEVIHTVYGKKVIENFVLEICNLQCDWTAESFIEETLEGIREQVGDQKVLAALSGGVDSTVVATLVHEAIGEQLQCIFVDNGLLRKNEFDVVLHQYQRDPNLPVMGVYASDRFLYRLECVLDQ